MTDTSCTSRPIKLINIATSNDTIPRYSTVHLVIKENPGIGNKPGLQAGVNVSFILYPLHDHLKGRFPENELYTLSSQSRPLFPSQDIRYIRVAQYSLLPN